jgi:hypothetical protein
MCTKFRPVQFDFFASEEGGQINTDAINPIAPSELSASDLNEYVALLEVNNVFLFVLQILFLNIDIFIFIYNIYR